MIYQFVIPGRLPGLNEIIGTARENRYVNARLKKDTTVMLANLILSRNVPQMIKPVAITVHWYEPDLRRDVDNIQAGGFKFILDALVMTHRLKNDTREWVPQLRSVFPPPDREHPRIVVQLEELNGAEN